MLPGCKSAPPALLRASWFAVCVVFSSIGVRADQPSEPSDSTLPHGYFAEHLDVRVINVDVVVSDPTGRPVTGLDRGQFVLRLDGEVVPIQYFYAESSESFEPIATGPLVQTEPDDGVEPSSSPPDEVVASERPSHVVVLVDHTRLRAPNRRRAFAALREAVDRLGTNDRVAIVGIERRLVFYSDFIADLEATGSVLDSVTKVSLRTDVNEFERRQILGELARGMSGGIQARAALADESILSRIRSYAAEEFARGISSLQQIESVVTTLAGVPGRKTLLYLGEGIPTRPGEDLYVEYRNRFSGPQRGLPHQNFNTDYTRELGNYDLTEPMRRLATAANRAGVTLYSIDAAGNHGGEIRSALTEQGATSEAVTLIDENYRVPLEYASKATGGRLLISSGQLAKQLVDLVDGFRAFYSLGFEPPESWHPGSDHELRVEVERKGLVVRHPERIRLPEADEREAGATVAALMYQAVDNPLGLRATPGSVVPRDDGAAALPVKVEIPIAAIDFLPRGDSQAGSLAIYVSIKDAVGNPSRVQKVAFELAIPNDSMEATMADFAHHTLPIVLRKGDQQVAIGVRDNVSGMFSVIRMDLPPYSRF